MVRQSGQRYIWDKESKPSISDHLRPSSTQVCDNKVKLAC